MTTQSASSGSRHLAWFGLALLLGGGAAIWFLAPKAVQPKPSPEPGPVKLAYIPRQPVSSSGFGMVTANISWRPDATLEQIAEPWRGIGHKLAAPLDVRLGEPGLTENERVQILLTKFALLNYEAEPEKAYKVLADAREVATRDPQIAEQWLYTVIYLQGVTALRRGETDNCVLCRGESSCILPLVPAAIHTNPTGSRLAIAHFTEYLEEFPDDLAVQWLLNIAYMTLGEYPERVDTRFRISLDHYNHTEHAIGKFRDIGDLAGINRLNMAGGIIMDDFHNTGRLDIAFTTMDPTQPMVLYRNKGDGTFEDRTREAGLLDQLGGLNCVQADYNNDGNMDIFIVRGAWLKTPMRPSLLRNNGNGTFTDVTREAGLLSPMNSVAAQWADFDNDGWLDLFVCNETGPNRLYRNKGDGTFEEMAVKAGVDGRGGVWKGCTWFDYDNDGYPDLFLNDITGTARLYHNNRNGTFTDVTAAMGIDGPRQGFACWAFDYDNDGWPDIFATCYDRSVGDAVKGLLGEPHGRQSSKLYRNLGGKGFRDVTKEVGLDMVLVTMGSNFGDFDNDGFLDFYLGTGDPDLATLVPNRMFRNLGGKRFVDISSSSGTGHLQKGHGVACGDWNRDGNVDIAIEMGGAIMGDKYHNILFQNPGQGNHWLNVKLVGRKTNRCAIGARIKVVTAGDNPLTIYRYVCSGSSFGANPLEQMVGLGKADKIAVLEIFWPTSGETQVFRDLAADQAIEITEFAAEFCKREYKPIPLPK